MRNLLDFLARYHHLFLFVFLEALSLTLLFRHNRYQGSVWFSSANVVSGKVYEWDSAVKSYLSLGTVNQDLMRRNLALSLEVNRLQERLARASGDSVVFKQGVPAPLDSIRWIQAKVIANSIDRPDNLMTIDKGSRDGVRKDMGVVSGTGVVGVVYLVSDHYSVVIPVLNVRSHVSCAIQGRGYFGYLRWQGPPSDIAYVDDVPRHARFKYSDPVVTSGYSSMFPAGIPVGKILHVFNSKDGLSYTLQIRLATDFGNLRDVCVIDDSVLRERLSVMRAAQDSIKSDNK